MKSKPISQFACFDQQVGYPFVIYTRQCSVADADIKFVLFSNWEIRAIKGSLCVPRVRQNTDLPVPLSAFLISSFLVHSTSFFPALFKHLSRKSEFLLVMNCDSPWYELGGWMGHWCKAFHRPHFRVIKVWTYFQLLHFSQLFLTVLSRLHGSLIGHEVMFLFTAERP